MTQYEHALIAMKRLLDAVGESHWARWIETNIHDCRSGRDTTHHRSAYGGMGSFNDVCICRANHHTVSESQEPWANTLFESLKSLCYDLANHPHDFFDAPTLAKRIGRHDSALAAFVGGDQAPASSRGYVTAEPKLQGWRCLSCRHSEASNRDIDCLIADDVVPNMVFSACEGLTLDQLVDLILSLEIQHLESIRASLASAVTNSGISLKNRDGWMRPCPQCGKDDTGVYRWRLITDNGFRFEPSEDNLELREQAGTTN